MLMLHCQFRYPIIHSQVILFYFSFFGDHHCGWAVGPMESHWLGFARRSPLWVSHWLPHLPFVQEIWHFLTAIFSPKSHYSCPIYLWCLMVELANEMVSHDGVVWNFSWAQNNESSYISPLLLRPLVLLLRCISRLCAMIFPLFIRL